MSLKINVPTSPLYKTFFPILSFKDVDAPISSTSSSVVSIVLTGLIIGAFNGTIDSTWSKYSNSYVLKSSLETISESFALIKLLSLS